MGISQPPKINPTPAIAGTFIGSLSGEGFNVLSDPDKKTTKQERKMNYKKWIVLLIAIMLSLVSIANIVVLIIYFFARSYLYFCCNIPFMTYTTDLLKFMRGAS